MSDVLTYSCHVIDSPGQLAREDTLERIIPFHLQRIHKPQALGLILVGPVLSVDVANASLHTDWHWPISHVGCSPLAGKALCLALFGS